MFVVGDLVCDVVGGCSNWHPVQLQEYRELSVSLLPLLECSFRQSQHLFLAMCLLKGKILLTGF